MINHLCLLNLINRWWTKQQAPKELFVARVAPFCKKGDADNVANCRPISLLSTIYKAYMIITRCRMQNATEKSNQ